MCSRFQHCKFKFCYSLYVVFFASSTAFKKVKQRRISTLLGQYHTFTKIRVSPALCVLLLLTLKYMMSLCSFFYPDRHMLQIKLIKPWTLTGRMLHNFSLFLIIVFQISSQTQLKPSMRTTGWAYPCLAWYSTASRHFFLNTGVISKFAATSTD